MKMEKGGEGGEDGVGLGCGEICIGMCAADTFLYRAELA